MAAIDKVKIIVVGDSGKHLNNRIYQLIIGSTLLFSTVDVSYARLRLDFKHILYSSRCLTLGNCCIYVNESRYNL